MAVTNKEICDKTREALNLCVDYVQIKLNGYLEIKRVNDNPRGNVCIRDYITALDRVSSILTKIEDIERKEMLCSGKITEIK